MLLIVCVAIAVFVPSARLMVVILSSILLYVPSYFVWFALQYFPIVPVDRYYERCLAIIRTNWLEHG